MLFSTLKVSLPGSLLSLNLKGFDTTESVTFICKEVGLAIFLFLAFQTILRWSSITIFNKLGLIAPSLIINLLSAAKELSVTFIWSFSPLTFIFLRKSNQTRHYDQERGGQESLLEGGNFTGCWVCKLVLISQTPLKWNRVPTKVRVPAFPKNSTAKSIIQATRIDWSVRGKIKITDSSKRVLLFNVSKSELWFYNWFSVWVMVLKLSYNGKDIGQKDSKPRQVLQSVRNM